MALITTTRANFGVVAFMARERDGVIQVLDMWPSLSPDAQMDMSTVTDAPQTVINELAKRGYPVNDRPIIYMDENDVWDVIKVHNGNFDNFMVLHQPTWAGALAALVSGGVLTKKDLKRPPVIDGQFKI